MAASRARIAAVEAALTPTELVVRWLDEAHAVGSLDAYVGSLLDDPDEPHPLDRLLRATLAAAKGTKSRKTDPDGAVHRALLQTAFRFELVMRINVATHELLDREVLRSAVLSANWGLLAAVPPSGDEPSRSARMASCLQIGDLAVTELLASAEARSVVERRYLAGHPALFPDEATRFAEQLTATQTLTALGLRLAEIGGLERGDPGRPDAVSERAAILAEDLTSPSVATAYEKLGAGREAFNVATRWLRGKLRPLGLEPA